MNATVEIANACTAHWVPEKSLCEDWLNSALKIAKQESPCIISLKFVELSESTELNTQYRDTQSATNVLSFPSALPAAIGQQLDFLPLGDIVVCPEILEQEAKLQEKEIQAHWAHLLIHGLLHLLSYDHETEESANTMENMEIKALESLGFPNPYLIG